MYKKLACIDIVNSRDLSSYLFNLLGENKKKGILCIILLYNFAENLVLTAKNIICHPFAFSMVSSNVRVTKVKILLTVTLSIGNIRRVIWLYAIPKIGMSEGEL